MKVGELFMFRVFVFTISFNIPIPHDLPATDSAHSSDASIQVNSGPCKLRILRYGYVPASEPAHEQ